MAEKIVKTRIQQKHDTETNWITAANAANPFIPMQGEIIVYDIDKTHDYERFKIGDGVTNVKDLPFADEAVVEELTTVAQTANNASTAVANLETRLNGIVAQGGEPNVINKISVNGDVQEISNKTVNIMVPTKVGDLTNDLGYLTSYTEADPTVPSHVKSITTQDITNWNAKSNFSGNYNDLTNKPDINNATLTIQKNGTNVATFTANSTSNATANIVVPTKTSDLTNDSGFKTTDGYHTSGSWADLTYTATAVGGAGELKFTVPTGTSATTVAVGNHTHSYIPTSQKGAASGVAELDANGKVPSSQLPSFVDDVIEGTYVSDTSFKATSGTVLTGETGKIYVDTTTNKTYRWSGSKYVEISASLALGETSATAYRGDRGKIAYDHSQTTHAPSNAQKNSDITKAEIEAKLTGTITSHTHSYASLISSGTSDPSASTASQYYFKY